MNVGTEVEAGRLKVGDRIRTMRVGTWPGGPCTVTQVGPRDENEPDIVLCVRHDDPAVRAKCGDEIGCLDWEWFERMPEEPIVVWTGGDGR